MNHHYYHQYKNIASVIATDDDISNNSFHNNNRDEYNQSHRPSDTTPTAVSPLELLSVSPTVTDNIFYRPSSSSSLINYRQNQWSNDNDSLLSPSDIIDYQTSSSNNEESNISAVERGIAGFVSKLYQCLQAPDDGHKYARWCRHNGIDMFIIDCIPKFTDIVLPRLFKHCKFASFVRQLNIYGFQRDTDARKSRYSKDKETCRWHHIHFRPGRRDLFHLIRRKTPRYSRKRRAKSSGKEDPETILNIGSGDDDEEENEESNIIKNEEEDDTYSFISSGLVNESRRSVVSSTTSSSITLLEHQSSNYLEYNRNTGNIFDDRQDLEMTSESQNQQQTTSFSSALQPILPQQYCHFPSNSNSMTAPLPALEIATMNDIKTQHQHQNQQQHHDPLSVIQQQQRPISQEEELHKFNILELKREFLSMYRSLSGEVNKAYNLIEVQKSRIEYLENILENNQMNHNSSSNLTTPPASLHNNNNQQLIAIPTLTFYHRSHHQQCYQHQQQILPSGINNGGYDLLFINNAHRNNIENGHNNPSSSSVNAVPEKWVSATATPLRLPPAYVTTNNSTQISGLSGVITGSLNP